MKDLSTAIILDTRRPLVDRTAALHFPDLDLTRGMFRYQKIEIGIFADAVREADLSRIGSQK
jgi:hypothetical protein